MKKTLLFLLLFLSLKAVTFAQNPQPSATPPKEDVVVINTNIVQFDITVTDKDGKVVTGLADTDFEVLVNGKPQKISNFSFISADQTESGVEFGAATNKKADRKSIPPPPVPTKLTPGQVRRTIALVVDDLGLSFANTKFVKSALKKFVDNQMQPGDLVAIIRTGSGIGALQQFTSDKRLLYAAIEKVKFNLNGRVGVSSFDPIRPSFKEQLSGAQSTGREGDDVTNSGAGGIIIAEGLEQDLAADRAFSDFRDDTFTVGTLGAVRYIVNGMGALPGRKAVMLLSEGFSLLTPAGPNGGIRSPNPRIFGALRKLTDDANRSGVVIYSMDPRGLEVPMLEAKDELENISSVSSMLENRASDALRSREDKLLDTQNSLKYLAEETGGFAIINQNDISKGIQRVLNDQNGYYLIAYEPDDETFDPKKQRFNKIVVRLKRPDLRVRYRSGFLAFSDREAVVQTPQEEIIGALTSPFTKNDINLKIHSVYTGEDKKTSLMRTFVHIKGGDLKFVEDAGGFSKTKFEILATTFGDNGEVVDMMNRIETIKAKADALEEIQQRGLVYSVIVPVKKTGAYQMRFVLRDMETGKVGSAHQFIEVPNLKKKGLTLSGIAVQRQANAAGNTQNQIQSDERRDIALRRFNPGMNVQFSFEIYNAKPDKPLTTQFKLFRDGREVFVSDEQPLTLGGIADTQSLSAGGGFSLGKQMPPGDYVLQVIVRDSPGSVKGAATQWIDFEVVN